jgi:hypothetical protein
MAVVLLVSAVAKEGVKFCVLACIYKKGPQVPSGSITQLVKFNSICGVP